MNKIGTRQFLLLRKKKGLTGERFLSDNWDLSRVNLEKEDLSAMDFEGANFTYSKLRGVDFRFCNLQNADFSHADMRGVDLRGAQIMNAKFECTSLCGAKFGASSVERAVLKRAQRPKKPKLPLMRVYEEKKISPPLHTLAWRAYITARNSYITAKQFYREATYYFLCAQGRFPKRPDND